MAEPAAQNDGGRKYVLGLLTDPGVPGQIGRWLQRDDRLADRLHVATGYTWQVEVCETELRLDPEGNLPVMELGQEATSEYGWDVAVLISDLPRRAELVPILADYSSDTSVAMLSVPALGGTFIRARALRSVSHLVADHLNPSLTSQERAGPEDESESSSTGRPAGSESSKARRIRAPIGHIESGDEGIDEHIALRGARGRARLLAGMVRANRPWRLLPSLSPAMAGAAAGAAFGIFYSNIWMLADAFSLLRLAMVGALAIAAMIIWLTADNGLWERPSVLGSREMAAIANSATTLTITAAVLYMYVLLFVVSLAAAFVVIPASHMGSNLGHSVALTEYAKLAWLATSMGTIAGALGSGLSDEEAVKRAAYSRREYQRRQQREAEQEEVDADVGEN